MVASSSAREIGISPGPGAARILGLSFVWQLSWKQVARQSEGAEYPVAQYLEPCLLLIATERDGPLLRAM